MNEERSSLLWRQQWFHHPITMHPLPWVDQWSSSDLRMRWPFCRLCHAQVCLACRRWRIRDCSSQCLMRPVHDREHPMYSIWSSFLEDLRSVQRMRPTFWLNSPVPLRLDRRNRVIRHETPTVHESWSFSLLVVSPFLLYSWLEGRKRLIRALRGSVNFLTIGLWNLCGSFIGTVFGLILRRWVSWLLFAKQSDESTHQGRNALLCGRVGGCLVVLIRWRWSAAGEEASEFAT